MDLNTTVCENGVRCGYVDVGLGQWVVGKDEYSLEKFYFFKKKNRIGHNLMN